MIFLRYFLKDVFFYSVEEFELAIEQSEDAPRGRKRGRPESDAGDDSDSS